MHKEAMKKEALEFGRRVRREYLRKGYNRSTFARAAEIGLQTVIDWEKGKYLPGQESAKKVSDTLGLPVSDLLGEKKSESAKVVSFEGAQAVQILHGCYQMLLGIQGEVSSISARLEALERICEDYTGISPTKKRAHKRSGT